MIAQVRPADWNDWLQAQPARPLCWTCASRGSADRQRAAEGFDARAHPDEPGAGAARRTCRRDRPIAILCHHGARSQRVAMFLAQQGYTEVANIAGGIEAWSRERDPGIPRY
jgi:rhodanese-related sulfurtransferase